MAYIPNAADATEPREGRGVGSAAAEFRALKTRLNTLYASITASISGLSVTVAQALSNSEAALNATGITLEVGEIKPFLRPTSAGDLTNYVVANGRKLGPTGSAADLTGDDFYALFCFMWDMAIEQSVAVPGANVIYTHNGTSFVAAPMPAGPPSSATAWSGGVHFVALPQMEGRVIRGHNPNAAAAASDPNAVFLALPDAGRVIGTLQAGSLLAGSRNPAVQSPMSMVGVKLGREKLGWDKYYAMYSTDQAVNGYPYLNPTSGAIGGADYRLTIANASSGGVFSADYNSGGVLGVDHLGVARMDNIALTYYVRYK